MNDRLTLGLVIIFLIAGPVFAIRFADQTRAGELIDTPAQMEQRR